MEAQIAFLEREQARKVQYKKALAATEATLEKKKRKAEEEKTAIEENAAKKVVKARAKLQAKLDKDMVAMNEAAKVGSSIRTATSTSTVAWPHAYHVLHDRSRATTTRTVDSFFLDFNFLSMLAKHRDRQPGCLVK
ncbi:MAG: hypothetical protein M1826_003831 [Phylliscum demangeonii]|nr:MAG: hypothetical protein M1826_003831 [Phylliscum demangeonii]